MKKRTLSRLNIKCLRHLALQLHYPQGELSKVCNNISRYYLSGNRPIKGKVRHIDEPISELRVILDRLQALLSRIELPDYLHGGRKGRSIITNAQVHIGQTAVLNFDIQEFFPSIHLPRVEQMFMDLGCSRSVASILTRLTTYNGCVPHGSPTSTTVANLCIIPLAERINKLAKKHKSGFTQFIDDGVMSGPAYLENLRKLIDKIIKQEGFTASPKPHKRKTAYRNQEQLVTGVKVNYRIDVSTDKYEGVKDEIQKLKSEFQKGMEIDKKSIISVKGKINHIRMLNQKKGNNLSRQFAFISRE